MPYVNIKITREGNVTPEQKKQLIEGATELLHRVLNKNTATTAVSYTHLDVYKRQQFPALSKARLHGLPLR